MRKRSSKALLSALALATLLLLAACGGGGSAGGGTKGIGSAGPTPGAIVMKDFSFQPGSIDVTAGTSVTWTNDDPEAHTVTADDNSFDSKQMASGQTFSFTFQKAGTYKYHCSIHPSMVGQVVVK
jgi:plastocyanin